MTTKPIQHGIIMGSGPVSVIDLNTGHALGGLRWAEERMDECARLREALEKFGVHDPLCTSDNGQCPEHCDCGLSKALAGGREL